jgi:hypothetical protein
MLLPEFFTETLGLIIMKNKDLVFYAISAFSLALFVLLPAAAGFSIGEDFPGISFLQEWIKSGEQFVSSKN